MKKEQEYAFRTRLDNVHEKIHVAADARPSAGEVTLDQSWTLQVDDHFAKGSASADLRDFLEQSFQLSLGVGEGAKTIVLESVPSVLWFDLLVTADRIVLHGNTRRAVHRLEDRMKLREAPFLTFGTEHRTSAFSPRMVHSGWGLDQFPDSHLDAISHAGFDSILLFVKGVNQTTYGYLDFNDLIRRAAQYGLGVYFYSYLPSFMSPDDPGADEFFEKSYGAVFQNSPDAKGLIIVGESAQFPSRDPDCSGKSQSEEYGKDIADHRCTPGFWPCCDYPQWLNAVKKAVRRHAPAAELVFWTYNWGKAPDDKRLALIRNLPSDVILEATFEMYEKQLYPNHTMMQSDYSITFPGPGHYFSSEAQCAKERNLPLYTMSNTAGRTWDFGCVPYMPFPQQWIRRFQALLRARDQWGLRGLMDSHHYGWYPSIISECAKACFLLPAEDPEEILKRLLVKMFGTSGATPAQTGFQRLSEAMDSYTPGFDDQAGPLRCGPAYPFIFNPYFYPHTEQHMEFPTTKASITGSRWIHAFYQPESIYGQSWCGLRVHEDIRILGDALPLWTEGLKLLRQAVAATPEFKRDAAERTVGVAEFCFRSFLTMYHTKRWWLLNKRLEAECDVAFAQKILDEMFEIIRLERDNVQRAIPLAECDSSLGWEPSMDYIADADHLNWKLRQLDNLRDHTLTMYRKSIAVRPEF